MGTCTTLYTVVVQFTATTYTYVCTRTTVVHLHYEGTFVLSKVLSYNVVCVHSHIQLSYSIGFFSFFSFFSFFFAAF